MPKQMTVGAFGFTKSVTNRGNEEVVKMPLVVSGVANEKKLERYVCHERFCNNKGLSVHLKCRHSVILKPSNVIECINEKNQCKTVEFNSSPTESTNSLQSDTIQPARSTSSEPIILGTSSDRPTEIKAENSRGHQRRISRTNIFKSKIIELRELGKSPNEIMDMYSGQVSLSLISTWIKDRVKIMKAATRQYNKMFKIRFFKKYIHLCSELILEFSTARNQRRRVDFNWLWSKARKINRELLKEDRIIRTHVIVNFNKRSHLKLRRTQRNRKAPKQSLRADLKE